MSISTRTLRRWASTFKNALSETASRSGRKRFFDGEDIQALKRAQEMLNDGLRLEEVATRLTVRTSEETTALILSPEAHIVIGEIRERSRQVVEKTQEQEERLERLEKWARQPWWKKIFTQPE